MHWAEILKSKEEQLWRDLSENNRLDFVKLRHFIINAFGDAVAYQRVPGKQADIYDKIHKKVHTELTFDIFFRRRGCQPLWAGGDSSPGRRGPPP